MSRLTEQTVERIRDAIDMDDLVAHYGDGREIGRDGKALCLFHDESTPSMSVDRGRALFHCFACTVEGDAFELVQLKERLDFRGAAEWLADRYRVTLDEDAPGPSAPPLPPLRPEWTPEAVARIAELRGWTTEAIRRLGLGIEQNRVAIPISDATGERQGVARYQPNPDRLGPGEPKMMATKGTPRDLFPAPERVTGDPIWIVEGEPDAITAHSIGLPAVGVPGTGGWKAEWAGRFRDRRVVVCCDCDDVGRKLARSVADSLQGAAREVRLVDLEPGRTDGYDLTDALRAHRGDHGQVRGRLQRLAADGEVVKPEDPAAFFGTQRLSEWQQVMLRRVRREEPPEAAPIPLPFEDLTDVMNGGMRPGNVITVAGYSGHAKSTFADMMLDVAIEHGRTGQLYMTEMSLRDRGDRYVARNAPGVPFAAMRNLWRHSLTNAQQTEAERTIAAMRWPATIITGWTIDRICTDILSCGWGIAVIDHLHDLPCKDEAELSEALRSFKAAAIESTNNGPGSVVVVVSQLNRSQMQGGRDARRPRPAMHSLKGTGAIQEVSEEIMFVWMEDDADGVATDEGAVWTAKGRNNATGSVAVRLDAESMRLVPEREFVSGGPAGGGWAYNPDQEAA